MAQNIVIYQDDGVGEFGLSCLLDFFKADDVRLADAASVINGEAFQNRDLFVMPGGADLPYCRKLNGAGNRNIRGFVEDGGNYWGICAGAYYACRDIEYHKGRDDEICGARELAFVNATAYGSLPDLAPWYNDTLYSAAVTSVAGRPVFYNGGCAFRLDDDTAQVLGTYDVLPGNPVAMLRKQVGSGLALLSGVHVEIGKNALRTMQVEPNELAQRKRLADSFERDETATWKNYLQLT